MNSLFLSVPKHKNVSYLKEGLFLVSLSPAPSTGLVLNNYSGKDTKRAVVIASLQGVWAHGCSTRRAFSSITQRGKQEVRKVMALAQGHMVFELR